MENSIEPDRLPFMMADERPHDNAQSERKKRKGSKKRMDIAGVKLSFETQRIRRASVSAPVGDIMLSASKTESLSFQPTIKISTQQPKQVQLTGLTIPTKVAFQDLHKSQVTMLLLTSFMGLVIGLAISLFI